MLLNMKECVFNLTVPWFCFLSALCEKQCEIWGRYEKVKKPTKTNPLLSLWVEKTNSHQGFRRSGLRQESDFDIPIALQLWDPAIQFYYIPAVTVNLGSGL